MFLKEYHLHEKKRLFEGSFETGTLSMFILQMTCNLTAVRLLPEKPFTSTLPSPDFAVSCNDEKTSGCTLVFDGTATALEKKSYSKV